MSMQFTTKLIPLAIALAFAGSASAQEVVKIGHVGPISGASAHLGKDNENGAKMAVEELNAKGFVIDDRSAYGQGVADEFVKGAKAKSPGVKIVGKEFTNINATDFTAILTSIKAKKPDLIFFGGMDSVGGPMLKQMKALGIQAKFMGGDGVCTEALSRLAGDGLGEGNVTCAEAGGVDGSQEKVMADFRTRYKQKFGTDVQLYAPYVYDAVMTMATAMQNAKSADPAKYLPELKKIKYQGVTGLIQFDNFGDIKDGALTLFTYKGGKKTKLEVVR